MIWIPLNFTALIGKLSLSNIVRQNYYNLLTSGKLNDYLGDVETQAQQMFDELVNALSRNENLTEDFKATDPMEWVRRSNNIRNRAAEIVNQEVIFS